MKIIIFTIVLLFSGMSVAQPFSPKELFSYDDIQRIDLSPDGEHLAYVVRSNDADIVTIMNLARKKVVHAFSMGEGKYVGYLAWANNERLLIKPARKYAYEENVYLTGKLQAVNIDGSNNVNIYGYRGVVKASGNKDRKNDYYHIASLLRDDPENILIQTYQSRYTTRRLEILNIYSGRSKVVALSSTRAASFHVDKQGNPIAQLGVLANGTNEILFKNAKDDWEEMADADNYVIYSVATGSDLILKQFDEETNTTSLIKFNRLSKKKEVLLTLADIEPGSVWTNKDDEVIGYNLYDGKKSVHFFDEKNKDAVRYEMLRKIFKGQSISISGSHLQSHKFVVSVYGDREPGAYYLYDESIKKLSLLGKNRKELDRRRLAEMMPVEFTARDGKNIAAYLTLPKASKGPVPMVVYVHGGPFGVRDYWGYDRAVQLLASHGYGVLQVNFRGSGGYGLAFKKAGFQRWGQAMQDDLTDATRWALAQGYAAEDKICIYGTSYGGYAALMGAVKEPELYRCAIGNAGVYDLPMLFDEGDIQQSTEGVAYLEEAVGTNKEELAKYSPINGVDKLKAALFLVHGKKDKRAPIEQYESLTKALDAIKYPYESMVRDYERHGFSGVNNNIEMYEKLLSFLDKHIGS